jgi:hypothetical protein
MRRFKVGYWPLAKTLDSAGDRRRLVFWAQARGHTIVTDLSQKVDVIVASENVDFNSPIFLNNKTPVVFDLVDAYLSPLNPIDDLARGIAKKLSGQVTGLVRPFSHHVRDFCRNATLVVCSSIEQEAVINTYSTKTRVILDSHDEIPFVQAEQKEVDVSNVKSIIWEGQPATIAGVAQISSVLQALSNANELQFNFVTDQNYFKLMNRYFKGDTLRLVQKELNQVSSQIRVIPWSPENLVRFANKSVLSIIPINLSIPMQLLKPENRLLIMWRLGLPCLTSGSPAYERVAMKAGANVVCKTSDEWFLNSSRFLQDPNYAKEEILKGQNYLRENHSREILLKKWDSVFESVLS